MSRSGLKAVLFDLDDTLYRHRDYYEIAFQSVAIKLSEVVSATAETLSEYLMSTYLAQGEKRILQKLLDEFGDSVKDREACIASLVWAYRTCNGPLHLYPDMEHLLEELQDTYKVALVTNGRHYTQYNKLRLLGIREAFDAIVITGEHFEREHWKPSPRPFRLALSMLNCQGKEAIYIGNDPHKDVPGATAVGMKVVLRTEDPSKPEHTEVVVVEESLGGMDQILQELALNNV